MVIDTSLFEFFILYYISGNNIEVNDEVGGVRGESGKSIRDNR